MTDTQPKGEEMQKANQDLIRFFYLSFKYSQGQPTVQHNIFRWVAKRNIFPNVGEFPQELNDFKVPKSHKKVLDGDVREESWNQWKNMREIISNSEAASDEGEIINFITDRLIDVESNYLRMNGRPNRKNYDDKELYKSHLNEYAILSKPTGHPVFDEIFSKIKERLIELHKYKDNDILSLEVLWELKNPGKNFLDKED